MSNYMIRLTPLDAFFFGQESKYRKKYSNGKNELKADYYQVSSLFPQQTSVLGMLRYFILQQEKQIPITDKEKAGRLVGDRSFDPDTKEPSFGAIKTLSPVFVIDGKNRTWFMNPADLVIRDGRIVQLQRAAAPFRSNLQSGGKEWMENFDAKKGLSRFLISGNDWRPLTQETNDKPGESVFVTEERIGIEKDKEKDKDKDKDKEKEKEKKGATREEAFYKQKVVKMRPGFSFGLIAGLDGASPEDGVVGFGAEKSLFRITFEAFDREFHSLADIPHHNAPGLVLLSDAFLPGFDEAVKRCTFYINPLAPFRFLKTRVREGVNYYSSDPLKRSGGAMQRSQKYQLLQKGSVFFFRDEDAMQEFAGKLDQQVNFRQIGYNHYKTIK